MVDIGTATNRVCSVLGTPGDNSDNRDRNQPS